MIENAQRTLLVVPCYNEADRWSDVYWETVAATGAIELLFVNDGSTDETAEYIDRTCATTGARALHLDRNRGKAEALRLGLLEEWPNSHRLVGFIDADGAFPATEVQRIALLAERATNPEGAFDAVWTARILMGGREINRHANRHYLGRAIATVVSPWHGYAIYDTQSGYKLFARSDTFHACLAQPFHTRWFPDIELLIRWHRIAGSRMRIWEEPVSGWHDVAGSKMNRSQFLRIMRELRILRRSRIET